MLVNTALCWIGRFVSSRYFTQLFSWRLVCTILTWPDHQPITTRVCPWWCVKHSASVIAFSVNKRQFKLYTHSFVPYYSQVNAIIIGSNPSFIKQPILSWPQQHCIRFRLNLAEVQHNSTISFYATWFYLGHDKTSWTQVRVFWEYCRCAISNFIQNS